MLLTTVESGGAAQFSDAELRAAVITMTRQNQCGFGIPDATDIRQCPTYSVVIAGDGTVIYNGKGGVRTIGRRIHTASAAAVQTLILEFEQAGFFSLKDRYESIQEGELIRTISHAVATTVSVSVGGKKKSVYDFYGTPDVMHRLERRIDEVSESQRYTGRDRQTLDPSIGPALPAKYSSVRDAASWLNPFVQVCPPGVVVTATAAELRNRRVPTDALRRWLVDLPLSAWPYGRIVALQECSIGSPADADERRKQMQEAESILTGIGAVISRWPAVPPPASLPRD